MATTPIRYNPQFTHDPWLDNVHRVQAAGDNGFNRRFYALEEEFGRIKTVMDNLAVVASELQAAVSALQAQMGGAVVNLNLTGKLGVGTTAPASRVQIKSLTALDEGATEAGAWANLGSNYYYDGAWKLIDPTKAGVNFHVNADGGGQEFRFRRIEADGANARDIGAIGTTTSFIAEGNVGIGTTAPAAKLEVNGAVRVTNGQLTVPAGATGGVTFPMDPGGGGGDRASITYEIRGGEDTSLVLSAANDAEDWIELKAPSDNGVKINGNTAWHEGNTNGRVINSKIASDTIGLDKMRHSRELKQIALQPNQEQWIPLGSSRLFRLVAVTALGDEITGGAVSWRLGSNVREHSPKGPVTSVILKNEQSVAKSFEVEVFTLFENVP